jgi:hypothetical protein
LGTVGAAGAGQIAVAGKLVEVDRAQNSSRGRRWLQTGRRSVKRHLGAVGAAGAGQLAVGGKLVEVGSAQPLLFLPVGEELVGAAAAAVPGQPVEVGTASNIPSGHR